MREAWYWIRNIRSFANGAPILLFINQKDQNPSANVNLNGLHAEYSNLKGVGIISALKDTREEFNNQVRDVICRVVSGMDTVHTPFAKSWLSLMNDLQKMPENYITSNAFYAKCKANSVEMKKELLDQIIMRSSILSMFCWILNLSTDLTVIASLYRCCATRTSLRIWIS